MRKRFVQQLSLGQLPIQDTYIPCNTGHALNELFAALKEIYRNKEYRDQVFDLLEAHICACKKKTGRKGMDLWCIFVLAQVRLCMKWDYSSLTDQSNNHRTMRQLMGIEKEFGYPPETFGRQTVYDNVNLLSDSILAQINDIIVEFGHKKVFKKKEGTALCLKSDSFVVESNVHFPTDYNLLWDCARKCIDVIEDYLGLYDNIDGWRKVKNWRYELKGLMREVGKASSSGGKNKQSRLEQATKRYLKKARAFVSKLETDMLRFPQDDVKDIVLMISLYHYLPLLKKHIDLVDRRILQGEAIPHDEKLFSVFETYTEWIKKGKSRPNVELGQKLAITTDQYDLIVDYQLMGDQQDRDIVLELADRILQKYNQVNSWSFDKGYWLKENKEILQLEVENVIMPKLGRRNQEEETEEKSTKFKRLKNKHSAIESNINELEHRGLDRCPDKGLSHYKRYISIGVCAYNLKKIGKQILTLEKRQQDKQAIKKKQAA